MNTLFNTENTDDIVKKMFDNIKEITENILQPNIIVCGKTGVGKSTLINSIFREDLAQTGIGSPVTQHLQKIKDDEVPVTLYDTKGLELSEKVQKEIREEIIEVVNESRMSGEETEYIHTIWYCISALSNRLEPLEEELIRELASSVEVPVILVLTQSMQNDMTKNFEKSIINMNLPVSNVISVMAQDYKVIEGCPPIPVHGLDKLVEVTYKVLPEAVQKGFINAQKVNIAAKERTARKYANAYIASTFVAGFSPIPCSDAPILVSMQTVMLANITAIFGLPLDKGFITTVVSTIVGSGSATLAGKFIVSNLLKHIPGVGTLVGGAISGVTATLLTASMARAYIAFMKMVMEANNRDEIIEKEEMFNQLNKMFAKELEKGTAAV